MFDQCLLFFVCLLFCLLWYGVLRFALLQAIALFEQDIRKSTTADISPNAEESELHLSYDTLTGEISGKGLTMRREGQHITVQGNQKPRARITFEVNYETLTTGEVSV
ncbi:MAG: hypothetical protein AAF703_16070 [Cyanobacteria bacterium P01_D01_bin.105]